MQLTGPVRPYDATEGLKLVQWSWRRSRKCESQQTDGQSEKLTWAKNDVYMV
jgi:hypothetical protein